MLLLEKKKREKERTKSPLYPKFRVKPFYFKNPRNVSNAEIARRVYKANVSLLL